MVDNTAVLSSGHLLVERVFAGYLTLFLWIKLCSIRSWQSYETNTDNTMGKGGDFIILKVCDKHDLTASCVCFRICLKIFLHRFDESIRASLPVCVATCSVCF